MKKSLALVICLSLLCLLAPSFAGTPVVTCKVTKIQDDADAELDITIGDFMHAGFELGDIVTVKSGSFEMDMPLLNGYYVRRGECMVNAYPKHIYIELSMNYGQFAEAAGMVPGDTVTLTLKEKGGARKLQEINDLTYTDNREDYASDEIFANFRAALPGKLYRSASPVNNSNNRAGTADRLMREAGIRTVLNLADTEEEVAAYLAKYDGVSPCYKALFESGSVLPMKTDLSFENAEFAEAIVKGFTFLADHDTPYLVHCVEGKDRSGFAVMLLEMLAGVSADQIITDYMLSYVNYYGVVPGSEQYDMIAENNIKDMILAIAGTDQENTPESFGLKAAAEQYLSAHGMSPGAIAALEMKLK